ncbi:MAG: TIR domain-containing protein, partial [Saprospiraceae bacterium]|nr:TIR domain-containing protein [Saprospiraceae bacterium]
MLGVGGYHIGWTTEKEAQEVIETALEGGIRFFDTAESYDDGGSETGNVKIFISHSSADKIIIDDFVSKILQLGLGIQEEDIFCTSIQGMDIRNGEDFVSAIKDELLEVKVIIVVLSNNYKESEICLNEMGAAWILGKKTYPMIIKPLKYSEVGFLHITKQIVKLSSSDDLDNFKESIEDELEIGSAKTSTWNRNKSNFLRELGKQT